VKVRLKKLFISRMPVRDLCKVMQICAKLCRLKLVRISPWPWRAGLDPSTSVNLAWYISISTVLIVSISGLRLLCGEAVTVLVSRRGLSISKTNAMVGQDQEIQVAQGMMAAKEDRRDAKSFRKFKVERKMPSRICPVMLEAACQLIMKKSVCYWWRLAFPGVRRVINYMIF